jgi:hypothetical protein
VTRRVFTRLGVLLAALVVLVLSSPLTAVADGGAKPPDPYPPALQKLHDEGDEIGISKSTGEYCQEDAPTEAAREDCMRPRDCHDYPAGAVQCAGDTGTDPSKGEQHQYEIDQLHHWEDTADHNAANYKKLDAFLTTCVTGGRAFSDCLDEGTKTYPPPTPSPLDWVAGKISKLAADALSEAAEALGHSVVWLLKQFSDSFNAISTIQLGKTGIGPVMGITTGLSALVATFLLLMQFGKLAVSQQGGPLVTAITGLAKWGVILAVYVLATQTALNWSDTLSTALINSTFSGGGSGQAHATAAMQMQLGKLFSGLVATGGGAAAGSALITGGGIASSAVGFVIIISILCLLAIGALWIEMLMRQAGIMILVAVMPLALAGQMADATKEWWPKARNALISLIVMKPVIVLCFSIGFGAMAGGQGVRNVLVGLLIFVIAGFAWPAVAKFMTFASAGAGAALASGVMSTIGSSAAARGGGYQPALGGAGNVGGGAGYTRALEGETSEGAAGAGGSGSGGFFKGRAGSFMKQVGGTVGLGLQLAAVGKDLAESGLGNAAAHGGLDNANPGGRHVVVRQRGERPPRPAAAPTESVSEQPAAPPSPPAVTSNEGS